MATHYSPAGSRPDVQVTGPSQVMRVQIVAGYTKPSSVYFEVPVPHSSWVDGTWHSQVDFTAAGIEQLLQEGYVVSGFWAQDLDDSGLIRDYIRATIQIPTPPGKVGPFETQVDFALGLLASDPAIFNATVVPLIQAAVQQLEDTANA